jgi:hypothetical protein
MSKNAKAAGLGKGSGDLQTKNSTRSEGFLDSRIGGLLQVAKLASWSANLPLDPISPPIGGVINWLISPVETGSDSEPVKDSGAESFSSFHGGNLIRARGKYSAGRTEYPNRQIYRRSTGGFFPPVALFRTGTLLKYETRFRFSNGSNAEPFFARAPL